MSKISKLIFFLFLIFPALSLAQELKVNNIKTEQGQTINLFYDDLDGGKINFAIRSENSKKAEITIDKGRSWKEMQMEKDYFVYAYRPLSDEIISPEIILTSEEGSLQTIRPNATIRYQKKKPDEAVRQVIEKLKFYYENENISNFINLFSFSYPDRVRFQEAIQNDFYNYKNLRLFYRIDQLVFDDDYAGVICTIYWERKGDNRTGTSFSDTAIITTRLDKEGSSWLISGFRNNTIFGSTLLATSSTSTAQPELSVTSADLSKSGTYGVTVNVHNTGNASANNIRVDFYDDHTGSYTLHGSQTIGTISANSSATATLDFSAFGPGAHNFEVIIDPLNTISEADKTNNTAIKNITLG